jgi:hypothetical protein
MSFSSNNRVIYLLPWFLFGFLFDLRLVFSLNLKLRFELHFSVSVGCVIKSGFVDIDIPTLFTISLYLDTPCLNQLIDGFVSIVK